MTIDHSICQKRQIYPLDSKVISNEKSLNGLLHNLLVASVPSCMFLQDLAEIFYLSVKMYVCLLTLQLEGICKNIWGDKC